jgi:hypothetical protein
MNLPKEATDAVQAANAALLLFLEVRDQRARITKERSALNNKFSEVWKKWTEDKTDSTEINAALRQAWEISERGQKAVDDFPHEKIIEARANWVEKEAHAVAVLKQYAGLHGEPPNDA